MRNEESQSRTHETALKWKDYQYELQKTGDLSPTLRRNLGDGESMHHMGGAWSETKLIYGTVIEEAFRKLDSVKIVSVGLGLGYNEFLTAALALQNQKDSVFLTSFEVDENLKKSFLDHLDGRLPEGEIRSTYEEIMNFVERDFHVNSEQIRIFLKKLKDQNHFILRDDFQVPRQNEQKANVVLYDAYSSKTNQELWTEDFLKKSIEDWTDEDGVLATYACTGALKRALQSQNFQFIKKEGFQGKRNSSLGRRGVFSTSPGQNASHTQ